MRAKIRKGDTVVVIAGKDKGKTGEVMRILEKKNRMVVKGVHEVKRHTKPNQANPQGGIVTKEATIHVSNVMYADPDTGKPTRLGKKLVESGKGKKKAATWERVAKKSGKVIESARSAAK